MVFPKELQPWLYTSDPEQMVTILDALESVTNGMENPGLLEQIERIPIESPLRPYVDLIFALQAYYRNEPSQVSQFLQAIPDHSPPARLKPLLSFLAGLTEHPPEGIVEKEIIKTIQKRKSYLQTALEEAELFLQKDHEESFSDSIAYIIRELYGKFPLSSKQLTLWALGKIREKGWDGSLLEAHLKMIFGDLEASRLKALCLLYSDHRHSDHRETFKAWSSFLMKLLFADPPNEQAVEASLLIWIYTGIRGVEDPERTKDILSVLEKKHPSLGEKYSRLLKDLTNSKRTMQSKRTLQSNQPSSHFPESPTSSSASRKKDSFGQLELFSC